MTEPDRAVRDSAAHIMALELRVGVALDTMKRFYGRTLGLPILRDEPNRLDVRTGSSTIAFVPADGASDAPFYHFAFNIPENQILAARTWQLARTPLLPIPERLRDRAFPDDVVDYRHWNAHSIFFLDPAGNVVEYIARHDLDNASRAPFGLPARWTSQPISASTMSPRSALASRK